MNKEQVFGLVRHVLTFVGGIAVAKGVLSDSTLVDAIGAVMTLVGVAWSMLSKKTA